MKRHFESIEVVGYIFLAPQVCAGKTGSSSELLIISERFLSALYLFHAAVPAFGTADVVFSVKGFYSQWILIRNSFLHSCGRAGAWFQ